MNSAPAVRRRRRGRELEEAIFGAVISLIQEVGYGRLTMDGIAARARTAKSALYRRWSTIDDLVIAAAEHVLPGTDDLPDSGNLRTDLVACLARMREALNRPHSRAILSLLGELPRSPELQAIARERVIEPKSRNIMAVLGRGVKRGEARAGGVTPYVAMAGPALVLHLCVVQGVDLTRADLEDIVDQVILPAVRPG